MESIAAVLQEKMLECHYLFADYNRSTSDIKVIAQMFERHLCHMTSEEVRTAFDHHIATADRFPTIKDILSSMTPVTCYRFDYGPLGFGGLYHKDHPYARRQMAIPGQDISGFAVEVTPSEATSLRIQAQCAPPPDNGQDEAPRIERSGSGFRQITFEE